MGYKKQVGWNPVWLKNFELAFQIFEIFPEGLSTSAPLFPHTLKSTPLGSLVVSCFFEFQVHPSNSNIMSQIIQSTPISNICKLAFMYTLSMLMDLSLELPFISVLVRKKHPWTTQPWFTQGISSIATGEQHIQTETILTTILFQCKGQSF